MISCRWRKDQQRRIKLRVIRARLRGITICGMKRTCTRGKWGWGEPVEKWNTGIEIIRNRTGINGCQVMFIIKIIVVCTFELRILNVFLEYIIVDKITINEDTA